MTLDLVERPGPGLAVLALDGDIALWVRARTRKPFRCALTGEDRPAGTDAYRPVGNQQYRGRRIDAAALDQAIAAL